MLSFTPTTSMVVVGEKLCMDPQIGQPTCCELEQEPFFSGVVALSNAVDDIVKGCHIWRQPIGSVRVAYVDWREKLICRVDQVSPVWCTSIQIVVTLVYE
jgi:hypothetical protein